MIKKNHLGFFFSKIFPSHVSDPDEARSICPSVSFQSSEAEWTRGSEFAVRGSVSVRLRGDDKDAVQQIGVGRSHHSVHRLQDPERPRAAEVGRTRASSPITPQVGCMDGPDSNLCVCVCVCREDLWVREGRILDPEKLFFDEQGYADKHVECGGGIIAPGFIDVQINGKHTRTHTHKHPACIHHAAFRVLQQLNFELRLIDQFS